MSRAAAASVIPIALMLPVAVTGPYAQAQPISPVAVAPAAEATPANKKTPQVPGRRLQLKVTGERLDTGANISVRGITGRARSVRQTVVVRRAARLKNLAPGRYKIRARTIRTDGFEARPTPKRFVAKVGRKRGAYVRIRYSACNQANVRFNKILVPSCGVLWGAVANAFASRPGWPEQGPDSHRRFEKVFGRTFGLYSYYFSAAKDNPFPRETDIDLLRERNHDRVMLAHWKVADGLTFADVTEGEADDLIDRQADYLKANFPETLFVSIQSEGEWQVDPRPDSGRTAQDYAAMYRYVVDRMRANRVKNVIWVLAYGGYGKWATSEWFDDLYPGDAYVDWIAWNPYANTIPLPWGQDFAQLMNSTLGSTDPSYQGMYNRMTALHPDKPLMLGEFGVVHDPNNPDTKLSNKAVFYRTVKEQLAQFPAIKAIVKFDTVNDKTTGRGYDISVLTRRDNRRAFRELSQLPWLVNPVQPFRSKK